jgi:hypothetical protein
MKKKTYCLTANIRGWFFIEAEDKENAENKFRGMVGETADKKNLEHFTIDRINRKPVIDEIPF